MIMWLCQSCVRFLGHSLLYDSHFQHTGTMSTILPCLEGSELSDGIYFYNELCPVVLSPDQFSQAQYPGVCFSGRFLGYSHISKGAVGDVIFGHDLHDNVPIVCEF